MLRPPAVLSACLPRDKKITSEAATRGVEIENNGSEPLVSLRYFGPNTWPKVPNVGDYKKN